jgi:DNA-binding protein H-NS
MTAINITAYTEDASQIEAIKAVIKAFKIKYSISNVMDKKEIKSDVVLKDNEIVIPDSQKKYVRSLVKKYQKRPELLVSEKDALKIIG